MTNVLAFLYFSLLLVVPTGAVLQKKRADALQEQEEGLGDEIETAGMEGLAYVHMQVQRKSYSRPWEMALAEIVGLPALIVKSWGGLENECPGGSLLIVPGGHSTAVPEVKISHPKKINKVNGKILKNMYFPHRLLTLICSEDRPGTKPLREFARVAPSTYDHTSGGTAISMGDDLLPVRSGAGGSHHFNYQETLKLIKGSGLNSDVMSCIRLSPQPTVKVGFFVQKSTGSVTGYIVENCLVEFKDLSASTADQFYGAGGPHPEQVVQLLFQMPGGGPAPRPDGGVFAMQPGVGGMIAQGLLNPGSALTMANKSTSAVSSPLQTITAGAIPSETTSAEHSAVTATGTGSAQADAEKANATPASAATAAAGKAGAKAEAATKQSGEIPMENLASNLAAPSSFLEMTNTTEAVADPKDKLNVHTFSLGTTWRAVENLQMQQYLGLGDDQGGILVQRMASNGALREACAFVQPDHRDKCINRGSLIIALDDNPITPSGSLICSKDPAEQSDSRKIRDGYCRQDGRQTISEYVSDREKVLVTYRRWNGKKLSGKDDPECEGKGNVTITKKNIRGEDVQVSAECGVHEMTVWLKPREPLLQRYDSQTDGQQAPLKASYVIIGGMIFTKASVPMIVDLSGPGASISILPTLRKRMLETWKRTPNEELVVLVGSLETTVNKFYSSYAMQQLHSIKYNGEEHKVENLQGLVSKLSAWNVVKDGNEKFVELFYKSYGPAGDFGVMGGVAKSLVTHTQGDNGGRTVKQVEDPIPDIVLSAGERLGQSHMEVLQNYMVPSVVSADLCEAASGYLDQISAAWCSYKKEKENGQQQITHFNAAVGPSKNSGGQVDTVGVNAPPSPPASAAADPLSMGPTSFLEIGQGSPPAEPLSHDEMWGKFQELKAHGSEPDARPRRTAAWPAAPLDSDTDRTVVNDVTAELLAGFAEQHRSLLQVGEIMTPPEIGSNEGDDMRATSADADAMPPPKAQSSSGGPSGASSQAPAREAGVSEKVPLERVVKIYNTGSRQLFMRPWTRDRNSRATGSGLIILPEDVDTESKAAWALLGDKLGWKDVPRGNDWIDLFGQGLILTNAHVVSTGVQFHVQRMDEDTKFPADVLAVGRDVDLAVLRLRPDHNKEHAPKKQARKGGGSNEDFKHRLFDKEKLSCTEVSGECTPFKVTLSLPALRDHILVVGFPKSGDAASMTEGVVSRVAGFGYVFDLQSDWINHSPPQFVVQVDAAINPGNSGGPVFNSEGRFCGLAFASLGGTDGMGYVIPTAVIKSVLPTLLENAKLAALEAKKPGNDGIVPMRNSPTVPEAGFTWRSTENPSLRRYLGLDSDASGVAVMSVSPYSPARCGSPKLGTEHCLEHGDVIMKINNAPISPDGEILINHGAKLGPDNKEHKDHSLDLRLDFEALISAHMLHHVQDGPGNETIFREHKQASASNDHDEERMFTKIIETRKTAFTVKKRGQAGEVTVEVNGFEPIPPLAPRYETVDAFPNWFHVGGLVFTRFTMPLLSNWIETKQPIPCLTANTVLHEWKLHDRHEVVVLLDTLNDPMNMYLEIPKLSILDSVDPGDGEQYPITSMAELVTVVSKAWQIELTNPDAHIQFRFRRGRFSDTDIGTASKAEYSYFKIDDDDTQDGDDSSNDVADAVFKVADTRLKEESILENYGVPMAAGGWFPDVKQGDNCGQNCGEAYATGSDLFEKYCEEVARVLKIDPASPPPSDWMNDMLQKAVGCARKLPSLKSKSANWSTVRCTILTRLQAMPGIQLQMDPECAAGLTGAPAPMPAVVNQSMQQPPMQPPMQPPPVQQQMPGLDQRGPPAAPDQPAAPVPPAPPGPEPQSNALSEETPSAQHPSHQGAQDSPHTQGASPQGASTGDPHVSPPPQPLSAAPPHAPGAPHAAAVMQ
jgi:S1-C subfamily serine protease